MVSTTKKKNAKPVLKPTSKKAAVPSKSSKKEAKPAKSSSSPKAKSSPLAKAPVFSSFAKSHEPSLSPRLQAAVDKSEIADLVASFARSLDRLDETLLRSVFHADASLDLGPGLFQGTASDYAAWVFSVLQQVRSSHHLIGSVQARLEGDVAYVETYAQVHFRLDKPTGREDVFMGKRYLDRMERRPAGAAGIWKIVHRKEIIDWVRTEAVSEIFYHLNPDALWSYRTKTDPSYQMEQFPGSQAASKLPAFLGRRYDARSMKF